MNLTTKLLIGVILALAGTALYFYFFRSKSGSTADTKTLATASALQASQLAALNTKVDDKVSRTDLANILQTTQTLAPTNSVGVDQIAGVAPDAFINSLKTKLTN